jgi:hypothetical protein
VLIEPVRVNVPLGGVGEGVGVETGAGVGIGVAIRLGLAVCVGPIVGETLGCGVAAFPMQPAKATTRPRTTGKRTIGLPNS